MLCDRRPAPTATAGGGAPRSTPARPPPSDGRPSRTRTWGAPRSGSPAAACARRGASRAPPCRRRGSCPLPPPAGPGPELAREVPFQHERAAVSAAVAVDGGPREHAERRHVHDLASDATLEDKVAAGTAVVLVRPLG